jgi:hypothetical protein
LNAWEVRFDIPVVFCPTPALAAKEIERWAFWFAREMVETVNEMWRKQS